MATFSPMRGTKAEIENTPIIDGQFLIEIDQGNSNKIYADNRTDRLAVGGAVTIDPSLNRDSSNPIQNKGVAGAILNEKLDILASTDQNVIAGAVGVKTLYNELNDSLTWKLLGSSTGTTPISLPEQFNEINILFCHTKINIYDCFYFNRSCLDSTLKQVRRGFYNSSVNYGEYAINVNEEQVLINLARYNGAEYSLIATISVYYR